MLKNWCEQLKEKHIPVSNDYKLSHVMCDAVTIRSWQLYLLPTDSVSTDNAILCTLGERWPLLIDPQQQGNRWIKNTESENDIRIVKISLLKVGENLWQKTLESSIRVGKPILLEDVGEELDPFLSPVLSKSVFEEEGALKIQLGDKKID